MSLTLGQGRTDVRVYTRHVNDTVRLTDTILNGLLNDTCRELRTWLQDVAPSLYLAVSGDIAIPDATTGQEIHLTSDAYRFERLYLVEQLFGDRWHEVERAAVTGHNRHAAGRVTFREEGTCLILGPDNDVTGTFRVKFHYTPAALTETDSLFKLPESLIPVLKYQTSAKVVRIDGDDPKVWETAADSALAKAEKALRGRYGAHPKRAGLRRVMGY